MLNPYSTIVSPWTTAMCTCGPGVRAHSAANVRPDRRQKRLHVDRFRDVAVASRFEETVLVAAHGVGGEGEDRDRSRLRIGLHFADHAQAVDAGEVNVHEDEVDRLAAACDRERFLAAGRFYGLVATLFEQVLDELHVHLVVLDDEDARGAVGHDFQDGFFAVGAGFAVSGKNFGSKSTFAAFRICSTFSSVAFCCTRRLMLGRSCSSGGVECAPALKMWTPKRDGTGSLTWPGWSCMTCDSISGGSMPGLNGPRTPPVSAEAASSEYSRASLAKSAPPLACWAIDCAFLSASRWLSGLPLRGGTAPPS